MTDSTEAASAADLAETGEADAVPVARQAPSLAPESEAAVGDAPAAAVAVDTVQRFATEPAAAPVPATGAGQGNGATRAISPTRSPMPATATDITLPRAVPSPMPVEELQPMLQQAGLTLVQTEAARLLETQRRLASEPAPVRIPRERPVLPPLDVGPLVQVETRTAGRSAA
jgi:ribonuclease E